MYSAGLCDTTVGPATGKAELNKWFSYGRYTETGQAFRSHPPSTPVHPILLQSSIHVKLADISHFLEIIRCTNLPLRYGLGVQDTSDPTGLSGGSNFTRDAIRPPHAGLGFDQIGATTPLLDERCGARSVTENVPQNLLARVLC